jgi:hypothetical protein
MRYYALRICGVNRGAGPRFFFRLFDEPHLVAGKVANHAFDGRFRLGDRFRLPLFHDFSRDGVLQKPSGIFGHFSEFDPVGAAIRAKIRFILHKSSPRQQYSQQHRSLPWDERETIDGWDAHRKKINAVNILGH